MRPLVLLLIAIPLAVAQSTTAQPTLKVRLITPQGAITQDVPLERYVAAVLAGESGVFQSGEALKAMAVAARTYAIRLRGRHSAEGYDFCATTHCQRFDPQSLTPRLEQAAAATRGELLWFDGKPAFASYARDCGGRTEDAAAVWHGLSAPYLKSHDDPYCQRTAPPAWQWSANPRKLAEALKHAQLRTPPLVERIAIAQRTASGRARTLTLAGAGQSVRISASSFRFAVGREIGWNTVLSDRYEVRGLLFEGSGSGHGVGLCQRGADRMGAEGRTYREILAFYYPGVAVGLTATGFAWQQLTGDRITLLTTHPGQDGAVLAAAERELRHAAVRTHLPEPPNVEIRIYPSLDAFRNATAEPGWVAAHTEGLRIGLQPAAVLRSRGALDGTLRHELLHVLLEANATAGLPVWFREGLAGYLADPVSTAVPAAGGPVGLKKAPTSQAASAPPDAALRQTADRGAAEQAQAEAVQAVAGLIRKYGEPAVMGWLHSGLPPDAAKPQAAGR